MRTAIVLLIYSCTFSGQTAPHIAAVVSGADFKPGIAPGGFASIFGTNLSDVVHQAAQPYPMTLGLTQVAFCQFGRITTAIDPSHCQDVQLVYASPGQINFLVPTTFAQLAGGPPSVIVVSVNGIVDDGASTGNYSEQNTGLEKPEPRIFFEGWDCFIDTRFQDANKNCGLTQTQGQTYQAVRGAITDQQGHLLTSSNRARPGQYYSVWMTGFWTPLVLGTYGNDYSVALTNIPEYQNGLLLPGDGFPWVFYPSYIGQSAQYPGLYQMNFQLGGVPQIDSNCEGCANPVPVPIPCIQYGFEVTLSIVQGFGVANLVQIPVSVLPSDLPGCGQ